MFPRIVLGLYRAELAIAQKDREQDGALEYGREKPSEIARRVVGEALHLGPDRVRDLCAMGRRHEKRGHAATGRNDCGELQGGTFDHGTLGRGVQRTFFLEKRPVSFGPQGKVIRRTAHFLMRQVIMWQPAAAVSVGGSFYT